MGLKGITMNTAPEAEAHIYAEDDAAIYETLFGPDGVSTIGQQCKATVLSNNKIRIADGVVCVGGHFARIPYGEYEDCEIENGQSGKNRNDIIVAKFATTGSGGIDSMTCEVRKGTAGTTAEDPELVQDNLYQEGKTREYPLYRVKIEGLNIVAVEQMFEIVPTNKDLSQYAEKLESIKITKRAISMTLEFNDYVQCYMKYIEIQASDIEEYGDIISVCFKGKASEPGNAYWITGSDGKTWAYASCFSSSGILYVTHMKGVTVN